MCFQTDRCWYAESVVDEETSSEGGFRCIECGRRFPPGSAVFVCEYEEYEECQRCFYADRDCDCDDPDFGNHDRTETCPDCHRFLDAIIETEKEEGCDLSESKPVVGEMIDAISYLDSEDLLRYRSKALELHPSLDDYIQIGRAHV